MTSPGIDPLPSGRWRLRLYVSGKRETIGVYPTEGEAETARTATLAVMKETAADYEGLRVADHAHKFLTRREVKKTTRDPDSDWSRYREHIKGDPIGKIAVRACKSHHVFAWLERLEDKGIAPQTRRNCLSLLRMVFRDAHKKNKVTSNPCIGVRVEGKDRDAWTYLTREELPRLLEACDPGVTRHLAAVSIGAGTRPGELVTLRRSDVILDDGRPRMIIRYGAAPDVPTKTGAVRTVHLFGLALVALQSWMSRPLPIDPTRKRKFAATGAPNPHDLVFPGLRGAFRDEDHVIPWQEWKGVLARARLGRRFRWYDFRHTCASWLVSGWWGRRWSLEEVREMLGHTSIVITQRYAHLAQSASEEAARATVGGAFSLSEGQVTTGHELLLPTAAQTSRNLEKMAAALLAPPTRVERATNGLGIHGIARSAAEIVMDDPRVTFENSDGSDDPPGGAPLERGPARWVLEATANLYELLSRKGGSCAA